MPITLLLLTLLIPTVRAQAPDRGVLQWGNVIIQPEISVVESYDNRTRWTPPDDATGDFYTETAAGLQLQNQPALFNLSGTARYGYRFYSEYTDLNDDFYSAGAAIGTSEGSLSLNLSSRFDKTLSYDTRYDPDTGQGPGSILTDSPSELVVSQASVGYTYGIAEALAMVPSYSLEHYYQTFDPSGSAEWQIHTASLQLRRQQTENTALTLTGAYSQHVNDDEDGSIGTLLGGIESKFSEHTQWALAVGYGYGDYEFSGGDDGMIGDLSVQWQVRETVSLYAFAGSSMMPGYDGGGARWTHRAGYGATYQPLERWSIGASVLHDYQEDAGDNDVPSSPGTGGGVDHFFNAQTSYRMMERLILTLAGSYNKDERDPAQTILSLGAAYAF